MIIDYIERYEDSFGVELICTRLTSADLARCTIQRLMKDLVKRAFTAQAPTRLWVADIERHEALLDRVEVRDLHHRPCRSRAVKLGATVRREEAP